MFCEVRKTIDGILEVPKIYGNASKNTMAISLYTQKVNVYSK